MILECADLRIQPGRQAEFERAIELGLRTVLSKSPGYRSHKLQRGIESPERYLLLVYWDSVEAHNEGFRKSPLFTEWRAIIGPFFAGTPHVEHFTNVIE